MTRLVLLPLLFLASGCQIGYLVKSSYQQMSLLSKRVPIEDALKDPSLDEETKRKLRLSQDVRLFAEKTLHLKPSKNYTSYVHLDRPYVTYTVNASPKWKLEHYLWSFPFVGRVPYKGFFNEADAKDEREELNKKEYDTFLRGVSAYSTLGWFNDPILSSMMRYKDHDLVNTIIHETVHATLYIKSSADFNERMAVFLGNKGTDLFYQSVEGADSPTLRQIQLENADDKVFSKFISGELDSLKAWYEKLPLASRSEEIRRARIQEIKDRFNSQILPGMQTTAYSKFSDAEINNARLMLYKTYMEDLSDFEKLFNQVGGDITQFLKCCEQLKNDEHPEDGLKKVVSGLSAANQRRCD